MYDILQLNDMLVPELREIADQLGLKGFKRLNKQELIYKILDEQALKKPDDEAGDKPTQKKEETPAKASSNGHSDPVKEEKRPNRRRKKKKEEVKDEPTPQRNHTKSR